MVEMTILVGTLVTDPVGQSPFSDVFLHRLGFLEQCLRIRIVEIETDRLDLARDFVFQDEDAPLLIFKDKVYRELSGVFPEPQLL